jgi:large subunit ribosomal protein L1
MPKHGRKYTEALAKVNRQAAYSPEEGLALVKETSFTRFDATVEMHVHLGVDPRHADQQVRGVVNLPSGLGREVHIVVFAEGEPARFAEDAGADYVGSDDLVERIQGGWLDFNIVIAIPHMMGKVGRLGRILGPRGLMPNPRAGTIVQPDDLAEAIQEARQGRVEFRTDRGASLHIPIGKASFTVQQLLDNFLAVWDAVWAARPPGAKGRYVNKIVVTSTMGPGIKVDLNAAQALRAA